MEINFLSVLYYSNIYYRDIEDGIEWYSDDSIEGANITTFINASSSYEYGLDFVKLPEPKANLPFSIIMGDADEVINPDDILN